MEYLYRAVDKEGTRSTFFCELGGTRLPPSAISKNRSNKNGVPETVTIDKSGASLAALHA